jgi:hypothetical protein
MANLEDPRFSGLTIGDILDLYRQEMGPTGRTYVFLDEVQMSPGWERWVHSEYERRLDVKFIVTGSSSSVVSSELATLLTGRTTDLPVYPLSFGEFLRFRGVELEGRGEPMRRDEAIHQLGDYIETGGFPAAVLGLEGNPTRTLQGYFDAILYRDVVSRHGVDPEKLIRLASYVLSNIGTLQSIRSVADACVMSPDTAGTYLWYLEQAMLLVAVPPLTFKTRPATLRHLRTKYFCVDTGLRNAVARRSTPDVGRLVENAVCVELTRRRERMTHWSNGGEVDFVLGMPPSKLTPVNVCYSDEIPDGEYAGISSFLIGTRPPHGTPLLLTRSTDGTIQGVEHVPVWRWLLEAGKTDPTAVL